MTNPVSPAAKIAVLIICGAITAMATLALVDPSLSKSKGVTVRVVEQKDGNNNHGESSSKHDSNTSPYIVTLPSGESFSVRVGKHQSDNENSNHGSKDVSCVDASSIPDFVACKNLISQQSIEASTKSISDWTRYGVFAAIAAFFAGAGSIVFLLYNLWEARKTNEIAKENLEEARRVNILQLQPWVTIKTPQVIFPDTEKEDYSLKVMTANDFRQRGKIFYRLSIPIKNNGKTPVKVMFFEIEKWKITYKGSKGSHLILKDNTKDSCYYNRNQTNAPNRGITTKITRLPLNPSSSRKEHIRGVFTAPDGADGDTFTESEFRFSFNAAIRFKDISTPIGKHRKITFSAGFNDEPFAIAQDVIEDDEGYLISTSKEKAKTKIRILKPTPHLNNWLT